MVAVSSDLKASLGAEHSGQRQMKNRRPGDMFLNGDSGERSSGVGLQDIKKNQDFLCGPVVGGHACKCRGQEFDP